MRYIELSDRARAIISNSLRTAATRYREFASEFAADDNEGVQSMASQFAKQAAEAEAVACDVDNAESIQVEQSTGPETFEFIGKR